jgi:hypothetical protein
MPNNVTRNGGLVIAGLVDMTAPPLLDLDIRS